MILIVPHASIPAVVRCLFLIVVIAGTAAGCKEATVGPELSGSIDGRVLDRTTDEPIAGVSITTSPPSVALATGSDGSFEIESIEPGNYTITASKKGYATNTVTVAVTENATRQAIIFLEPDDEAGAAFDVSITNWSNDVVNDSVFVNVEYRARNIGAEDIPYYEVYFRIDAGEESFYVERAGEELGVGQSDVDAFRHFIDTAVEAGSVVVEDFYFEGMDGTAKD